ncbi:hypothetical protein KAU43_05790 [candidate division WOR-3 bacterium]|nr:hypothetical protein [candidate division WOR-3 bacterium]
MKEDGGLTNNVGKNKKALDNSGSVGTGLTNGSVMENKVSNEIGNNGFTNGMGGDGLDFPSFDSDLKSKKNKRRKKKSNTFKFIGIIIIVILMVAINYMVVILPDERITITIDNDYREWTNLTDIGFGNFGVKEDRNTLYMTLQKDDILKGTDNITESYLIFVNDVASNDGYHIGYGSYEYYIDIYGYNNSIENAVGYEFDSSKNNSDWNGFTSGYSSFRISSANNQDQLEFSLHPIQMGFTNVSGLELLIFHYDTIGNYEYSQVIDVDVIKQVGLSEEGTRADPKLSYYHIFEKNELHIVTEDSLAYNSIPYVIRIIQDNIPTDTAESELQPSQQDTVPEEYESRDMATTIIISYEFWADDIIKQCGGHIYESTADNYSFTDNEMVLYGINKTVVSIQIKGDFGEKYIQEQGVRAGFGGLNLNSIPEVSPRQTVGNNTDLKARPTNYAVVIDGSISYASHGEWFPSEYYLVDVASNDLDIGVMKDENHLYVYLINYQQSQDNIGDFGEIYFDTWHNENTSPNNSTYKKFRCYQNDTLQYCEGSGSGWGTASTPTGWTGANTYVDGATDHQRYEFKIPLDDLSISGTWNEHGEEIGFGGYAVDVQTPNQHTWFPSQYYLGTTPTTQYADKPDEWGDIHYTNYTIFAESTSATITMDGKLDENAWTNDANIHTIDLTQDMKVYTMMDDTYVYVGVAMITDTTWDDGDFCQVAFDRDHTNGLYAQTDDVLCTISGDNSTTYYEGTGAGWSSKSTDWVECKVNKTGSYMTYEFRFEVDDLNNYSKFSGIGSEIGFMVMGTDNGGGYTIQYPDYYGGSHDMRYDPQCWGDIQRVHIPEFSDYMTMSIFMMVISIAFIRKRKDKITLEESGDAL